MLPSGIKQGAVNVEAQLHDFEHNNLWLLTDVEINRLFSWREFNDNVAIVQTP
jgi:hypothetical protein